MRLRPIPSLNWVRVFEAAARFESFARAAEVLNMSPPAVSQQIRALEGHLGTSLFERAPQRVRLTAAGRRFAEAAGRSLAELEAAAMSASTDRGVETVTLRAPPIFSASWVLPRLSALEAAAPELRLALGGDETPAAPGPSEVTIRFEGPELGDETPLFGESLYPVASPSVVAEIAQPMDLCRLPLIEIAAHRASWLQVMAAAGVEPNERLRLRMADNSLSALAWSAAGGGVALARAPATDWYAAQMGLQPCLPGFACPGVSRYRLAAPSPAETQAAKRLRAWLIAEARGRDGDGDRLKSRPSSEGTNSPARI